ncbi:tRNA (guanine9-N1)-methyltransferase [Apostasia shenzhenica]|uniref:tRNA (guanine(9)-N(1))-methyltransferase n=1 Tax=Apostasia shenzhenica TaxID=1088818 RepID=A0A2I0AW87_9ASPA|nr:tRNA (guanine9-N1)-methyltransferase [Apostasia shenzhenica]
MTETTVVNEPAAATAAADEDPPATSANPPAMSKSAMKRLLKQQRLEAKKAERKALEKERRRQDLERRRREWDEKLAGVPEEDRARLVASRKEGRRERMEKRAEERGKRAARLRKAAQQGQKIVLDLEFADLMKPGEMQSLAHQIMYCYAVNGRSEIPAHLYLTGCKGEIGAQLLRLPGYDKWIIEKEDGSYFEAFQNQKENLVYLTADAEVVLEELDPVKIYIIGGLVDRNRWKGVTMKKANEQGIQSARLPIANYFKLASSQILTVNQVVEILLKFLETKDWKTAFFKVIPRRKRRGTEPEGNACLDAAKLERESNGQFEEEKIDDGGGEAVKKQRTDEANDSEVLTVEIKEAAEVHSGNLSTNPNSDDVCYLSCD